MFINKTILILDDDVAILKAIVKHFSIKFPNNTYKTFNCFSDVVFEDVKHADVIILDYYFDANIDTINLIKEIKKINPNIFILSCSGMFVVTCHDAKCVNTSLMKDCLMAGADRVCPKDTMELLEIVDIHFKIKENLSA
jgi:DNA-binding NarL/FixJ family response regulator